jgi:hypothetical protein
VPPPPPVLERTPVYSNPLPLVFYSAPSHSVPPPLPFNFDCLERWGHNVRRFPSVCHCLSPTRSTVGAHHVTWLCSTTNASPLPCSGPKLRAVTGTTEGTRGAHAITVRSPTCLYLFTNASSMTSSIMGLK